MRMKVMHLAYWWATNWSSNGVPSQPHHPSREHAQKETLMRSPVTGSSKWRWARGVSLVSLLLWSFRKHVYLSALERAYRTAFTHRKTWMSGCQSITNTIPFFILGFRVHVMPSLWGFRVVGLQFRFPRQVNSSWNMEVFNRWLLQIFLFTPIVGKMIQFDNIFFWDGLVQPPPSFTKSFRYLKWRYWTWFSAILGVVFSLHEPSWHTYSLYRWGFLHFRYLKWLVILLMVQKSS